MIQQLYKNKNWKNTMRSAWVEDRKLISWLPVIMNILIRLLPYIPSCSVIRKNNITYCTVQFVPICTVQFDPYNMDHIIWLNSNQNRFGRFVPWEKWCWVSKKWKIERIFMLTNKLWFIDYESYSEPSLKINCNNHHACCWDNHIRLNVISFGKTKIGLWTIELIL